MTDKPSNPKNLPVLVNIATHEQFVLDISSISIGRSPANDLVLESDEYASGRHARIYFEGGRWWLEDLKSSNGTSVNDQLITVPHSLSPGNLIKIGSTRFRIE